MGASVPFHPWQWVLCATHFTRLSCLASLSPGFSPAKLGWECLSHRFGKECYLTFYRLEYDRHIMHLVFLPRLMRDVCDMLSLLKNLGGEILGTYLWGWTFLSHCSMLLNHHVNAWIEWLPFANSWPSSLSCSWIENRMRYMSTQWPQSFESFRLLKALDWEELRFKSLT